MGNPSQPENSQNEVGRSMANEPVVSQPATAGQPMAGQSTTGQPTVSQLAVDGPQVGQPVVSQSPDSQPVTDQSISARSTEQLLPRPAVNQVAAQGTAGQTVTGRNAALSEVAGRPKQIATLPPIETFDDSVPTSERTGEPRRHPILVLGILLLYAASAIATVAFGLAWYHMMQISGFNSATRLAGWVGHAPYEWETIVTACLVTVIAVAMIIAPGVAAYNAWCGRYWSRWAALIAVAVVLVAAFLLNRWAWLAVPLTVAGAIVLFLPQSGKVFSEFAAFRQEKMPRVVEVGDVFYGPLPTYK